MREAVLALPGISMLVPATPSVPLAFYLPPSRKAGMGKVDILLNRLPGMGLVELREQWFLLFQSEASNKMTAKLLRLAIGYRIQELEYGASARCAALRQKAAVAPKGSGNDGYGYAQHMKPGTRLLREYDGQIHEVLSVESGRFVYGGQLFRSLSEVARKIRGKPTSGTTFFGLRGKRGWSGPSG
jgi:hypothetical protein